MAEHHVSTVPTYSTVPAFHSTVPAYSTHAGFGYGSYYGGHPNVYASTHGYGHGLGAYGHSGYGSGYGGWGAGCRREERCKDPETMLDALADWLVPFNPERPLTSSRILECDHAHHKWGGYGSYAPVVRAPAPVHVPVVSHHYEVPKVTHHVPVVSHHVPVVTHKVVVPKEEVHVEEPKVEVEVHKVEAPVVVHKVEPVVHAKPAVVSHYRALHSSYVPRVNRYSSFGYGSHYGGFNSRLVGGHTSGLYRSSLAHSGLYTSGLARSLHH